MALTGYGRKCKLTIQNSKVPGTLSDFPVLLDLTNLPSEMFDADGSYPALNGGLDVKFSSDSAGETQLACEIVTFTINNDPALGKAEIHVKVPSVTSATDTDFYVWYNKAGDTLAAETDTYGKHNVWDSNYQLVMHMNDATTSTILDSTSNSNDATKKAANEPVEVDGQVGKAQSFDGVDDFINMNAKLCSNQDSLTIESLTKINSINGDSAVCLYREIDNGWNGNGPEFTVRDSTNVVSFSYNNGYPPVPKYVNHSDPVSIAIWYNFTATYSKGGDAIVYIDGVNGGSVTQTTASITSDYNGKIGWYDNTTGVEDWNDIDVAEFRISHSVRSANWLETVHNNQSDPATFIIEGTPETPGVDGNPFFLLANGLGGNTLGGNCSLMG